MRVGERERERERARERERRERTCKEREREGEIILHSLVASPWLNETLVGPLRTEFERLRDLNTVGGHLSDSELRERRERREEREGERRERRERARVRNRNT